MPGVSLHPLRGQTVLLVGGSPSFEESVVDTDTTLDELSTRIDEAVISLARAVFARGGRLAFWHDPVVTPLVVGTALEYWVPPSAEGSSERSFEFATSGRSAALMLGEPEDWEREWYESGIRVGHFTFSAERDWLRLEPSRIVCIGGDRRVFERLEPLRQNRGPQRAFALPTTGGAAHDLIREMADVVDDAETAIWLELERRRTEIFFSPPDKTEDVTSRDRDSSYSKEGEAVPQFRYSVYPLVMNLILDGPGEPNLRFR
jgi:hypothetical protein